MWCLEVIIALNEKKQKEYDKKVREDEKKEELKVA